jgi:hypothetical protein
MDLFCRLRAINVSHKNVQKGALFVIYAPKCSRNLHFLANLLMVIGNWLLDVYLSPFIKE